MMCAPFKLAWTHPKRQIIGWFYWPRYVRTCSLIAILCSVMRTKRCRRRNDRCRRAGNGRNVCSPGHIGGVCMRTVHAHMRTQEWNDAWAYLSNKHLFYAIKNDDNLYELDLRKVMRIYNDQSGVSSTSIGDAPDNTPSTLLVLVERGTSLYVRSASVIVERQWRAAIGYELKVNGDPCTRPSLDCCSGHRRTCTSNV